MILNVITFLWLWLNEGRNEGLEGLKKESQVNEEISSEERVCVKRSLLNQSPLLDQVLMLKSSLRKLWQ